MQNQVGRVCQEYIRHCYTTVNLNQTHSFFVFLYFFVQASYSKLTIVFLYKRNINVYIYNIIYMKRKEKEIEGTNEEINKRIFESATLSTPSIFHNHIVDVAIHVLEENRYRERE